MAITYGPGTLLSVKTYLALGADLTAAPATWVWTDVSTYVRFDPGITATTGRQDEGSRVQPGSATLTFDNRDGRFSRKNPVGAYYGQLSRNTPIKVVLNAGTSDYNVVEQFVNEWPARWDKTATDFTVTVTCGGILRRLGQGIAPTKSIYRRAVEATNPVAYWPMEDESGSTTLAEASGGFPMAWSGDEPTLASAGPGGSNPIPLMGVNTVFSGTVPAYAGPSPNAWTAQFVFKSLHLDAGGNADDVITISLSGGTIDYIEVDLDGADDGINVWYQPRSGGLAGGGFIITPAAFTDGKAYGHWSMVTLYVVQSGGNVTINTAFYSPEQTDPTVYYFSTPVTFAGTLGNVASITTPDRYTGIDRSEILLGHVAVWNSHKNIVGFRQLNGYSGETATGRIVRICSEEGIQLATPSVSDITMGPQQLDTPLNIIRDCELADGGVLYELSHGLGYQTRSDRYNAAVAMVLDVAQHHIGEGDLEPTDDDQRLRNRWTVSRTNGSSVVFADDANITDNGLYDDSLSVNVATDGQLDGLAQWLVHVGTNDEYRWPSIPINFGRSATKSLIDTWIGLGYGARITVANIPGLVTTDPVDAFIEGKTETVNQFVWTANLNTSPASVDNVFEVAATSVLGVQTNLGRLGLSHALAANVTSSATSWSVKSLDGTLLTTAGGDFPQDWMCGGERVTVTAVSGGSSPQTATVTRSVNGVVKAHSTDDVVSLYQAGAIAR